MSILSWLKRRRHDDKEIDEEIRAHLAIAAKELECSIRSAPVRRSTQPVMGRNECADSAEALGAATPAHTKSAPAKIQAEPGPHRDCIPPYGVEGLGRRFAGGGQVGGGRF